MDASTLVHKAKCRRLNNARHLNSCNQLCGLPDEILLHILAFLPTEDVVRTGVLSRRWEYLWTSIPSLVLREKNEETNRGRMLFRKFVQRALLLCDSSSMKAFSLSCIVDSEEYFDGNESRVNTWINAAIRHNVQDLCLYLEFGHRSTVYMLPCCIFRCGTLKELHLEMEHDLKVPSLVCLPNLKVLTLVDVQFGDDKSVEKLLSCPSLEKLSLDNCKWNVKVLEISAPNLLYLTIVQSASSTGIRNSKVRINGACIKSFDYYGNFDYDYVILSTPSLIEASIQAHLPSGRGLYHLRKLMKALSHVKKLAFSIRTFEDMNKGDNILKSLPVFHSLTELALTDPDVRIESRALNLLLSKCPMLRSLRFSVSTGANFERHDGILDLIPRCFASSIREIMIHGFSWAGWKTLATRNLASPALVLDKVFFACSSRPQKRKGRLMPHSNKLPGASDRCTISSEREHWDYIFECSRRRQLG